MLIIILLLLAVLVGLFSFKTLLANDIKDVKNEFEKISKHINVIKQIDNKYKTKKNNERRVKRLIKSYGSTIVYEKSAKNSIEFKVTKLKEKALNQLSKEIINNKSQIDTLTE